MEKKEIFLQESVSALSEIYDQLAALSGEPLDAFPAESSALVVIDMVNGFVKQGPLSSSRVEAINGKVAELCRACAARGMPLLAFCDSHTEESPEFDSYPAHCLAGDAESRLTDEVAAAAHFTLIPKNSTNGFLEPAFAEWLDRHPEIDTFLLAGDCTDLCVQQFALTLKADFNRRNRRSRVVVPRDLVETYDLGVHNAEFCNAAALYNMMVNGVSLCADVEWPR